jgi:hypothetical protein
MTENTCSADRILRIAIGVVLLLISYLALDGVDALILGLVAIYPIVTGILGFCWFYARFRIRACPFHRVEHPRK